MFRLDLIVITPLAAAVPQPGSVNSDTAAPRP
jgi:hypothetical protein